MNLYNALATIINIIAGLISFDSYGQVFISYGYREQQVFTLPIAERMTQMVFISVVQAEFELVTELTETQRGAGGFVHTDLH
ncbi:MAG: hypothetical protein GQ582_03970 [Methyloprofundus sp.]|nr:hypothetical protein [Methyloprofundus sp.]